MPKNSFKDFKILSLEYYDFEGNIPKFKITKIYELSEINSVKPVILKQDMPETIPYIGISYVNDRGETKYEYFYESGKDGALMIGEFLPYN